MNFDLGKIISPVFSSNAGIHIFGYAVYGKLAFSQALGALLAEGSKPVITPERLPWKFYQTPYTSLN